MITDKQIQKALRDAAASKKTIELKDPGERGAGRLAIVIRPMATRVAAEWYAVFYRAGRRVTAKLGSYPTVPVAEARRKFLTEYAPAISAGEAPAIWRRKAASNGTVAELFQAYVDHLERAGRRVAPMVRRYLLSEVSGAAKSIGGDRPASSIEPDDIVPLLATIHGRGSRVHANSICGYISAAYNFGLKAEHDFTRANVDTRWGLKVNPVLAIPADASAKKAGNRFLSPAEFREVWLWLDGYRKDSLIASAVMIKMATGQRTEEVLCISDTSYDRGKVMVHWDKTKNGLPHSIPLPHQAAAILDATPPNARGWFFPHQYDAERCAVSQAFMEVIRQIPEKTRHGPVHRARPAPDLEDPRGRRRDTQGHARPAAEPRARRCLEPAL